MTNKKISEVDINKMVSDWDLTPKQIHLLVSHVGDHAGAQGHIKGKKLDYLESCPGCEDAMRELFPDKNWW